MADVNYDEDVGYDYYEGDEESDEDYLAIEGFKSPSNDVFRPSLADQTTVGFFSQDRNTQTDVTEVVHLKDMTEVLQTLLEDVSTLKRDINFAKRFMQADYENKLQEKAIELYCRVNEKIGELERMHEDRVSTVRRAFKQQLGDALVRMSTYYSQDFQSRLSSEKKKKAEKEGKLQDKIRELQNMVQHNETVIQMLRSQIEEYQNQPTPIHEPIEEPVIDIASVKTKSPSINYEAEELREEVNKLHTRIENLEKTIDSRDQSVIELNSEIDSLNELLEKERIIVEQLKHEKAEIMAIYEQDKESGNKQNSMFENQKLALQREMEERIRQAREEALAQARDVAISMQGEHSDKLRKLMEAKKSLEEQLAMERSKVVEKTQDTLDYERMKKTEDRLRAEVAKLKREIDRIHKMWEKKFAILQQSLHALKDESFLRQTLQKQAAQLHQASISYATDAPLAIVPQKQQNTKQPLPDIPKTPKSGKDYLSYTVSAPSGRGTNLFSLDENQVMSDGEQDLPAGIMPIQPVQNKGSASSSRPSTTKSHHVVIVPSIEAK